MGSPATRLWTGRECCLFCSWSVSSSADVCLVWFGCDILIGWGVVCVEWEKLFPLAIRLERRNEQATTNLGASVSSLCVSSRTAPTVHNFMHKRDERSPASCVHIASFESGGHGDVASFHIGLLSQSDGRFGGVRHGVLFRRVHSFVHWRVFVRFIVHRFVQRAGGFLL